MTAEAWLQTRRHPVAEAVERLHLELDAIAASSTWSMTGEDAGATLVELTKLDARVTELRLRIAADALRGEAGGSAGATSTASWWASQTRMTRAAAHREMSFAIALASEHERVRDALGRGDLLPDQARVVVEAIDALPHDLVGAAVVDRAEAHLVELAAEHDAKRLRVLGRRILDLVAPEVGEAHERRQLEREEREAAKQTRFTLVDDGHGVSHGRFRMPTAQADMLRKQLLAIAAPRHQRATGGGPDVRAVLPERLGRAFLEYVERYPADRLPAAGGVSATVVVTMSLETLRGGDAAAHVLDSGTPLSPGQARRLACEAGIIPAVLGGRSQVLDLGRRRRFHTESQRLALALRDGGCTAEGCDWPPGMCHAHHDHPWSQGGGTSVERGRLLCPRHHARAHDPTYRTSRLPGGKVAFVRRT